jgi:hypothetical protein
MSDRLMQIVAVLVVAGFLGIVLMHVPRLDLGAVIVITLAAMIYDFFLAPSSGRDHR